MFIALAVVAVLAGMLGYILGMRDARVALTDGLPINQSTESRK